MDSLGSAGACHESLNSLFHRGVEGSVRGRVKTKEGGENGAGCIGWNQPKLKGGRFPPASSPGAVEEEGQLDRELIDCWAHGGSQG